MLVTEVALLAAAPLFLLKADVAERFSRHSGVCDGPMAAGGADGGGADRAHAVQLGLSQAHPVVITAVLNLSPFWAAIAARVLTGVRIPVSWLIFALCLLGAFAGTLAIAWSQTPPEDAGFSGMWSKGSWWIALPVPLFSALSGTLVGLWFKDRRDEAAIAAALVAPALALVPLIGLYLLWRGGSGLDWPSAAMLAAGAITAAGVGRLLYQFALSRTGEDNGFVTMFFLLGPGLSGLYSWISVGLGRGRSVCSQSRLFPRPRHHRCSLVLLCAARGSAVVAEGEPDSAP